MIRLANTQARRLFLAAQGLGAPPTGPAQGADLTALIERLGYVQVDSINTVERAHHMILFARRQSYRPGYLTPLLERDRQLFEHWTHDAAIIPMSAYPHWHHRFARDSERLHAKWQTGFRHGFAERFGDILAHIAAHGPVTSAEVSEGEARGKGGWWDWHPSKTALEWLWRTGALAITRREGFQKVYDLTERVIPPAYRTPTDPVEMVDWACLGALDRLGFATSGEIAAFYHAIPPDQARDWCSAALKDGRVIEVEVLGADGSPRRCFTRPDLAHRLEASPEPPARIRILSPFDPALRDRNRTERLFGYHYRIEVFVPEAQRRYGYYVFPVLEGAELIGRLDAKALRAEGTLAIRAFWPERGIALTKGRLERLEAELARLARFAGCEQVTRAPDWLRATA